MNPCKGCPFTRNGDRIHNLLHASYVQPGEASPVGETLHSPASLESKILALLKEENISPPDAIRAFVSLAVIACDAHDQYKKDGAVTYKDGIQ